MRKLQQLHAAPNLDFLRLPSGNRLEALEPLGISQYALAKAIDAPRRRTTR
ncbi:MAG TPA: hypothetical protein VKZ71_10980 [Burkholderiaceae bacterium]|nr:hypothetical protein [Burkholderiaceae bacterium]